MIPACAYSYSVIASFAAEICGPGTVSWFGGNRWIGFSEDDGQRFAGGASKLAAQPHSSGQRVEDNAFHLDTYRTT